MSRRTRVSAAPQAIRALQRSGIDADAEDELVGVLTLVGVIEPRPDIGALGRGRGNHGTLGSELRHQHHLREPARTLCEPRHSRARAGSPRPACLGPTRSAACRNPHARAATPALRSRSRRRTRPSRHTTASNSRERSEARNSRASAASRRGFLGHLSSPRAELGHAHGRPPARPPPRRPGSACRTPSRSIGRERADRDTGRRRTRSAGAVRPRAFVRLRRSRDSRVRGRPLDRFLSHQRARSHPGDAPVWAEPPAPAWSPRGRGSRAAAPGSPPRSARRAGAHGTNASPRSWSAPRCRKPGIEQAPAPDHRGRIPGDVVVGIDRATLVSQRLIADRRRPRARLPSSIDVV